MSNEIKHKMCQKIEFIKSYYERYNYFDDLLAKLSDDEKHVLYELCKKNNLIMSIRISGDCYLSVGVYYWINKNYELAKKYYLMAIEKGNDDAINLLGIYYKTIESNHELAKKYYLMAIEKGNNDAMYNLGNHYEIHEKNDELAIKYYFMGFLNGESYSLERLLKNKNFEPFLKNLGKLEEENKYLKQKITEFEYSPGGSGYLDAKKHFESLI